MESDSGLTHLLKNSKTAFLPAINDSLPVTRDSFIAKGNSHLPCLQNHRMIPVHEP